MKTRRIYGGRRAVARAAVIFVVFVLVFLVASAPRLPQAARIAFAAASYLVLLWGGRSALLCWRRDWDELWRGQPATRKTKAAILSAKQRFSKAAS